MNPSQVIAQYELGNYKNFIYLILDWKSRIAAIVDPQEDLNEPLDDLKKNGFQLESIFLTHTHFDHIAGVPELVKRYPEIPVHVHQMDQHRLDTHYGRIQVIQDGEKIKVGQLEVEVLHTPGHSAGECCYFISGNPPHLLTGDTLFIRDCGRTDLETGSTAHMFESLQRIRKLPPATVILPGHHYVRESTSTLEQELKDSPPFQCKSVQDLERLP